VQGHLFTHAAPASSRHPPPMSSCPSALAPALPWGAEHYQIKIIRARDMAATPFPQSESSARRRVSGTRGRRSDARGRRRAGVPLHLPLPASHQAHARSLPRIRARGRPRRVAVRARLARLPLDLCRCHWGWACPASMASSIIDRTADLRWFSRFGESLTRNRRVVVGVNGETALGPERSVRGAGTYDEFENGDLART
jgi:hypothetical protein